MTNLAEQHFTLTVPLADGDMRSTGCTRLFSKLLLVTEAHDT